MAYKMPMKQASDLASTMAKHGIPGSISMAKPMKDDPMDDMEPEDGKPEDGEEGDELSHCVSDLAEAITGGDVDAIKSALMDLVDCIKEEDYSQDQQE